MPHINLLPWRQQQRQASQKRFLALIGSLVFVAFFSMYMLGGIYSSMRDGQDIKNAYLNTEIALLDKQIREINELNTKKENLQQRMKLIEELQSNRNLGTQLIDEIARIVPAGIYLTSLERKGKMLKVVGRSESNNRLSSMLRNVESSYLLEKPTLQGIVAGEQQARLLSDFTMQFYIKAYEDINEAERYVRK
ncbi:PilN domain-containing protein [Pseudoalteromonas xiamenensis]|uniref:PilN domain-containing protein n=1 Tax=Pseudoalteromonas xiamenensis TaxID=882626 RepID=A0A975DFC7_9GAMM|nr:PilN domain-containing protein [Pseudoalteromonas xiamenensis]QTH70544.1 PilN domain-containing protein [Pseudoalteromonas xiamenensis]WMN58814.1 PilN domain-containing protein [Pseudoalteromonas xiamenensis]